MISQLFVISHRRVDQLWSAKVLIMLKTNDKIHLVPRSVESLHKSAERMQTNTTVSSFEGEKHALYVSAQRKTLQCFCKQLSLRARPLDRVCDGRVCDKETNPNLNLSVEKIGPLSVVLFLSTLFGIEPNEQLRRCGPCAYNAQLISTGDGFCNLLSPKRLRRSKLKSFTRCSTHQSFKPATICQTRNLCDKNIFFFDKTDTQFDLHTFHSERSFTDLSQSF